MGRPRRGGGLTRAMRRTGGGVGKRGAGGFVGAWKRVGGMLRAAGSGSRLGRPKALVELGGQTLAERGVALLRDGGADPVLVVPGAVALRVHGARTVHNPDWRTGMGTSLAAGLRALGAVAPGAADGTAGLNEADG